MYRVIAPLVLVRDELGRTHHLYEGAVVDVMDTEHANYLLSEGMVAVADSPTVDVTVPPVNTAVDEDLGVDVESSDSDPDAALPSRPPHIAAKARWVDFAVASGVDRNEAEAMSKQALIASLK